MPRTVITMLSTAILLLASGSAANAVPPHQHYLTTPSGEVVPIALGICANELNTALEQLHANVHLGAPADAFASNPVSLSTGSCQ